MSWPWFVVLFGLLAVALSMQALADTEVLTVVACTHSGCSTTNWNSNTTSIGANDIGKNSEDILQMSDSASTTGATINTVTARVRYDGAAGISGELELNFHDDANVGAGIYCSDISHSLQAGDNYFEVTPSGCAWTPARLDDLSVDFYNGDDQSPTPLDGLYFSIFVDYTPAAANSVPFFSTALADSPDTLTPGNDITYTATGDDPDGDNYRMTVCRTDSIVAGYPGTCGGTTLCTSAVTTDNTQASCVYSTVAGDADSTINSFAFLCDANSECNTTASTESTTVTNNKADWTANLAANDTSVITGEHIGFTATATDFESENYYLTVCDSNSINDAAPGTCVGNTVCTSSSTASGVQASCTNITNSNQEPSFTAYGFICDVGSATCNTSTSVAITVTPQQKTDWTVNLAVNESNVREGTTVKFNASGTDPNGDQYRLTVCTTDSITDGYPGTCNSGVQVCVSGATNSGSEASCTNTTINSMLGINSYYGFLCDSGSSTCNTSTSESLTVFNDPPDWTNNLVVNNTFVTTGEVLNFNATGNDPEGDQYYLTVCDTNGINDAAPGTCTGNTICTSGVTNDDAEASCTNTTVANMEGENNVYFGFLCDVGGSSCNTSTNVTVTIRAEQKTDWTVNLADSPDPVEFGDTITYTGTGVDPNGDQYRMTVCASDSISDAYPGTCTGVTLCTSSATNSGAQATCNYVTDSDDRGTLTAYGFLCDAGSQTCNTSTSTSTTVLQNKTGLVSTVAGTIPFYTNGTNPQNYTNHTSCLQDMQAGESCLVTWYVNATGDLNTVHEFWAYANSTVNSTVTNTSRINITIVAPAPAVGWLNVSITNPTDNTVVNINETFTINATVTCEGDTGASCGSVEALARYNISGITPDTYINVSTNYLEFVSCFQEQANESTAGDGGCAVYTGDYAGTSDFDTDDDWKDGLYDGQSTNNNQPTDIYGYVNYTIPSGYSRATWNVYKGASPTWKNVTVIDSCMAQSPLQLRIHETGFGTATFLECYDGSWNDIGNGALSSSLIHEESITWGDYTPQIKELNLGDSFNVSWVVNFTGDGVDNNESYEVDVLFNSTTYAGITANDTADRTVKNLTEEATADAPDINLSFGPPATNIFRWAICSPQFENASAEPQNQNATYGIDYVCNNGTATGNLQIQNSGSPNTNWTISASNTSISSNLIELTTSWQTIYTGLTVDACTYVWLKANCSYVRQGPGVYEQYQIVE